MNDDAILREHLSSLLDGRNAHVELRSVLARVELADLGKKPPGAPHTLWEVVEHLRLAQKDILAFSRDPRHVSPEFPQGYWPGSSAPQTEDEWERSRASILDDLEAMKSLVRDPEVDLFAKLPHGDGQTILREALVLADHNAYHLGQLVTLMKMLGKW